MVALVNRVTGAIRSAFKYDALEPRGKRRRVPRTVSREDHYARGRARVGLQSNAADLGRNMSLAAWMVRRHLDYVAQFTFHARNDSEPLNVKIERLMLEDSTPARFDIAGRFGREKMFRLSEMRRVFDGDTLLVKNNDGRLQGIQSDLIQDPPSPGDNEDWINGVLVTGVGRPLSYGIHKRKGYTEQSYLRRVNSTNVFHYGFFDRFATDQVRGISPLTSALNPLRDVYENFDYALAKAKVSHIFALSIYRDANQDVEPGELGDDDEENETATESDPYDFDLTKPNILTLDEGDRAEVLESKQPSQEFQDFTQLVIQVALKSLDIPYSFYDESHTNFFGSRAAWLHYERSCQDRRDDQIELRRNYTLWKLRQWIRDGRLTLPAGMTIYDLRFEWVPRGMPWWDPAKEIKGNVMAIAGGLDNPQKICRATGSDLYDNIDLIAKAQEYAKQKGVSLSFAVAGESNQAKQPTVEPGESDNDEN